MSKRHWFRFWMAKYLDGVRGLGDELGFAYTRLFVKMYENGGPLRFDEQQLKHLLEKRPQDVRRIVGMLVELGKLSIDHDGLIHNGKADDELASAGKWDGNEGVISASSTSEMEPHSQSHRAEKTNKTSRAHAITPADVRAEPERDTDTSPLREDVSRSPLTPPNENEPSVAHDLELTPSGSRLSAKSETRMANDWDLPPAPGPHGQTRFLKKFAKIQQAKPSH